MTEWTLRVTIIVPEALVSDANDLAMVLGQGPADGATFGAASYEKDGNLYAVASTLAKPAFPTAAASTIVRPEWDDPPEGTAYTISMAAAERAQAKVVIYDPENPVQASPDIILAIVHPDARQALEWAGVTRIETEVI
ncbi:hypothetical protein [Citreimonas sp.]|uniref:hypothetical protein n=1 Tax=Citreimonas sp. TaxID=3036715 RepID=UPI004058D96E